MNDHPAGWVDVGWIVCDVTGKRVGRIAHLYQASYAALGTVGASTTAEEVMELTTGFLGLGRRLYIPVGAIRAAMNGRVLLAHPRSSFQDQGWFTKPPGVTASSGSDAMVMVERQPGPGRWPDERPGQRAS